MKENVNVKRFLTKNRECWTKVAVIKIRKEKGSIKNVDSSRFGEKEDFPNI